MLIAFPYLLAAAFCIGFVEDGGSGWLSLLALLFVWNAFKFIISGPATLVRLVLARHREARARRLSVAEVDGLGDLDRVERPTRAFVRS